MPRHIAWLTLTLALAACGSQPQAELPDHQSDLPAFFDCARQNGIVISAHRGGTKSRHPENALSTLTRSIDEGIYLLEVDVRTSKDGTLVLLHDETLDRTTNGSGLVDEHTYDQLSRLRLKTPKGNQTSESVPTLASALELAKGRAILQLDIKRGTNYKSVVETVKNAGAEASVVYITYTVGQAKALARLAPGAMISTTVRDNRQLKTLLDSQLDSRQILAFVGTEDPGPSHYRQLNKAGIEAIIGKFGSRRNISDRSLIELYELIIQSGATIVSTDHPYFLADNFKEDDAVLAACAN